MGKNEHSPLPWRVDEYDSLPEGIVFAGVDKEERDGIYWNEYYCSPGNAALIVRAVNSHEELRKLLQEQLEEWDAGRTVAIQPGSRFHLKVREALAKAKGESQ